MFSGASPIASRAPIPRLSDAELAYIEDGDEPAVVAAEQVSVRRLLRMREVWGCIAARMLTDPISYFFIFWTPLFLQQERGFDLAALGRYSWIPFVALAAGNIAGGAVPRFLAGRGWTIDRARKTTMAAASITIPICCGLITCVPNPALAIAFISAAMFCHAEWANMTLPAEVFPKHVVASVSGFGGACGALLGAFVTPLIGWTAQNLSFTPVFLVVAFLPLTAWFIVCALVKNLGVIREIPA